MYMYVPSFKVVLLYYMWTLNKLLKDVNILIYIQLFTRYDLLQLTYFHGRIS